MKAAFLIAIRLVAVTVLYFICFAAVSAALLSPPTKHLAEPQTSEALVPLLTVSFLISAVFAYLIVRSRWTGWKLILTIFFVFYGVITVLPQIETAFFVTRLPSGMVQRLFLSGAIIAALFAPLAVIIFGKTKAEQQGVGGNSRLDMSPSEWAGKLFIIIIAYVVIYFTFGYFIAWKSEAVHAYYGKSDPGSLLAQMSSVLKETPLLIPLQAVRAVLWAAIAVVVIRTMKGKWWEAGLAVALLFAVTNSQLLIPNPLMPQEVRMVHLVETASSNFLFGWVTVLVLHRWRNSQGLLTDSRKHTNLRLRK